MNKVFEENLGSMLSLGFALHGKIPRKSADPERTILALLPSFFQDRKLFRLLLAWLGVASNLIHVERLRNLAEELPQRTKFVLSGVALKVAKTDRRWRIISDSLQASLRECMGDVEFPKVLADPYLVSKYGRDEEFAQLGIEMARVIPEDERKILSLRGILKGNSWLRLRALIGSNFRADTAYLYVTGMSGPARLRERCAVPGTRLIETGEL